MFERIPNLVDLTVFAAMALLCALVVAVSPRHDSALFFASVPLFFVSSMMGLRRSRQRAGEANSSPTDKTQP